MIPSVTVFISLLHSRCGVVVQVGVSDIVGRIVEDLKDESGPYLHSFILSLYTCCGVVVQVGVSDIVGRIVEDLKDESEPYRRMVMETVEKVMSNLGAADLDARLEELLIDGILYAFQEQVRPRSTALCPCSVPMSMPGPCVHAFHEQVGPGSTTPCPCPVPRLHSLRLLLCQHQCQCQCLCLHLCPLLARTFHVLVGLPICPRPSPWSPHCCLPCLLARLLNAPS